MEQTCKYCGSTWKVTDGIKNNITVCPFCDKNVSSEMTVDVFLKRQVEEHGYTILEDAVKLNGMLADYFPKLKRERASVRKALEYGAGKVFFEIACNKECDAENHIEAFRKKMSKEAWMADAAIDYVCSIFCNVIGYETKEQLKEEDHTLKADNNTRPQLRAKEYIRRAELCADAYQRAKYYEKAVEIGSTTAMERLGYMYEQGYVPAGRDIDKAIEYYQMAAQRGDSTAKKHLERAQETLELYKQKKKLPFEQDREKKSDFEKMEKTKNSKPNLSAQEYMKLAEHCADSAQRTEYYSKAAQLGNAEAMHKLGCMYYYGETGGGVDLQKAVEFFGAAARRGHVEAKVNLGCVYYSGEGVARDLKKAFMLFSEAAVQGNSSALFNLGVMYEEGEGVKKNLKKAFSMYSEAASSGHDGAQKKLEQMGGLRKLFLKL